MFVFLKTKRKKKQELIEKHENTRLKQNTIKTDNGREQVLPTYSQNTLFILEVDWLS